MKYSSYYFFETKRCPNSKMLRDFVEKNNLTDKCEFIDATEKDGLELAKKYSVTDVPTLVFIDENGNKIKSARTIEETKDIIMNKGLDEF